MKAAGLREIKAELKERSHAELVEVCLRLARHKVENKELMTYLLMEAHSEEGFVEGVERWMDEQFALIDHTSWYVIGRKVKKIQDQVKKFCRFSKQAETIVLLHLYLCEQLKATYPFFNKYRRLNNIYLRSLDLARKSIVKLHEDLQYDYSRRLEELENA